ncbi:MAG: hypothetical protein PGN13_10930 [Patulibacter minatonensis]
MRDNLTPDQASRYSRQLESALNSAEGAKVGARSPVDVAEVVAKALSDRRRRRGT